MSKVSNNAWVVINNCVEFEVLYIKGKLMFWLSDEKYNLKG